MGVIQSLTIERGGDDRLWNVDGMPLEINCTVTIQDMYNTTTLTKNNALVSFNVGLNSYLDNMAGIRSDKLLDLARYEGWLMSKLSKLHSKMTTGFPLMISDGAYSFISNMLK